MDLMKRLCSEGWDAEEVFLDMLKNNTTTCDARVTAGVLGCYWHVCSDPSLVEALPKDIKARITEYLPGHVGKCRSCSFIYNALERVYPVDRNESAEEAKVWLQ